MRCVLLISILSIPLQVLAKDITCFEMERSQDVSGWIPVEFQVKISEDLESVVVERPILKQFGQDKFDKGLFGSDYWARGSGKSKGGEYYNYSLQLRFKQNFKKYTVSMQQQGFRDLVASGECELTSNLYQAKQTPEPDFKSNAALNGRWSTPSKPAVDNFDVNGITTFYSPDSSTFININLHDGYYEHSSENSYFQKVYENARSTKQGQYIFYLGNDDFKPYESAWRKGIVEAFTRNGRKFVRISDPTMKNFAWQSDGANLRFYIRVNGNWVGKELSGTGENKSKLNDLAKFSD